MTMALATMLADFGVAAPEAGATPDQASYDRGHAAGRAEAEAEWAERAAEIEAAFEDRLAKARAAWTAEEGQRLADAVADGIAGLERRIGDQAASVLDPFLKDAARERALDGLATAIRRVTGHEGSPAIRVTGPRDLIESLRRQIDSRQGPRLAFGVDETLSEITVTVGATRLSTAIGAWQNVLTRTLAS